MSSTVNTSKEIVRKNAVCSGRFAHSLITRTYRPPWNGTHDVQYWLVNYTEVLTPPEANRKALSACANKYFTDLIRRARHI